MSAHVYHTSPYQQVIWISKPPITQCQLQRSVGIVSPSINGVVDRKVESDKLIIDLLS